MRRFGPQLHCRTWSTVQANKPDSPACQQLSDKTCRSPTHSFEGFLLSHPCLEDCQSRVFVGAILAFDNKIGPACVELRSYEAGCILDAPMAVSAAEPHAGDPSLDEKQVALDHENLGFQNGVQDMDISPEEDKRILRRLDMW